MELNVGFPFPLLTEAAASKEAQKLVLHAVQKEADLLQQELILKKSELTSRINSKISEINFLNNQVLASATAVLNETLRLIELGNFSFIDYQLMLPLDSLEFCRAFM